MFPFVVDQRYCLEPSLQIYRASRSVFKANTRGQKPRQPSQSSSYIAPPPAYTSTVDTNLPKPARKATSGSTATISSASSTSSTSSKRSKLARLNPFRRHKSHSSGTSTPTSSLSPTPTGTSAASSTTAGRRTRSGGQQPSGVRFADDPYDSDASSVYSTDFAPEERHNNRNHRHRSSSPSSGTLGYPRDVDENSTYPAFLFLF